PQREVQVSRVCKRRAIQGQLALVGEAGAEVLGTQLGSAKSDNHDSEEKHAYARRHDELPLKLRYWDPCRRAVPQAGACRSRLPGSTMQLRELGALGTVFLTCTVSGLRPQQNCEIWLRGLWSRICLMM